MLEPILKGLVEWIYEMMLDIFSYASGELLGVMSMDLSYFESTAPIISDIVDVFIALGWALLIGNLVFQSLKVMMSGAGFEAEDPKTLFLRTFVFAFLLLASRQICDIGLSITGKVIDLLALPNAITVTTPDESMFSLGSGAKWLLVIIVGIVLMVQMVKLLFEIGERYVITSVLTFFAPLAFAMGGSKNTNDIFKGWVRMYCSMLVMMIMNIVFLKLIMSAMSQMAAGGVLVWLVFVVALTRVARKIDSHIGKIGLNPAQTGNALGSRIPGIMTMVAVRSMGSLVSKSMANAKGGSGGSGGKDGRGGAGGTSRPHANPNGPRPSGSGGNTSTHYTGTAGNTNNPVGNTTVNPTYTGVQIPNGGKQGVSSGGYLNTNQTVNQSGGKQNHKNTGEKNRPPIPRNTAQVNSVNTSMGATHQANIQGTQNNSQISNGVQMQKGNTKPSSTHKVPMGMQENIRKTDTPNVNNGGSANVFSQNSMDARRGGVTHSGNISGVNIQDTKFGGNSGGSMVSNSNVSGENIGGANVSGRNISGMNTAGNVVGSNTYAHSNNTHIQKSAERNNEHHTERHNKNIQMQSEVRKAHEYKHGRYNPAASNKKVKKTYYQKDDPEAYRQNRESSVKRGGNNRTSKPKQ